MSFAQPILLLIFYSLGAIKGIFSRFGGRAHAQTVEQGKLSSEMESRSSEGATSAEEEDNIDSVLAADAASNSCSITAEDDNATEQTRQSEHVHSYTIQLLL